MDFGGRAWKEALPAKLSALGQQAQTQAELIPHLAREAAGGRLPGPPPRNRRLFRVSISRAISRCRASIRSTRSNGRSARRSSATKGQGRLRAARRRDSEVLVAAGDQHRRLEVFPRPDRHARARAQRQAADRPRRRHDHAVGARAELLSPATTRCRRSAHELKHLLVYQKAAFNSPVWFNCGFEKAPQCSACFINSVQDTMDSILTLARTEGMLFKFGSGTGSNLSAIRSSKELLAGGGTASAARCRS